jgi:hypothetical protein
MIVCIDYDDTIAVCDFPRAGTEIPGAIETIRKIQEAGHYFILWTCREGEPLQAALDFLRDRGVVPDAVNDHSPHAVEEFVAKHPNMKLSRKIYAHMYIDDKSFGGFPGWKTIADYFEKLNGQETSI